MGAKSKGNYLIPECIRFKCKNRGKRCDKCIRYSEYEDSA